MAETDIYHGGALDKAAVEFGGEIADWLDLSTGINPYHYPLNNVPELAWTQLPQARAMADLLLAASGAYKCQPSHILAANGTQALIEILPQILPPSKIAIVAPTYQEHELNWQKHGHEVVLVSNVADAKSADHALIVNPNNPTGKLFSVAEFDDLRQHFAAKKGFLIIDEAFIDLTPDMSLSHLAGKDGLIILRSFGKFFGLAGLRIGFILGNGDVLGKIRKFIGLWSVTGMSMHVATQALNDAEWQDKMRQKLADEMREMRNILVQNEFKIIGGTDLFCLVNMPKNRSAYKYFEKLAKRHILTRKFADDEGVLRFGLAKATQQNEFAQKLAQICEELNG